MKRIVNGILILLSLYCGVSQAQDSAVVTASLNDLDLNAHRVSTPSQEKAYLEKTRLSIGTILKSYHFGQYEDHDFNETHNGLYLNINNWTTGTYTNSTDRQSVFITHNTNLYRKNDFKVDLVTGLANNYDGWKNAQNGYLPMLGASVQWSGLKVMLSYDVAAFGFELPLN
jgi:hypothetical protein